MTDSILELYKKIKESEDTGDSLPKRNVSSSSLDIISKFIEDYNIRSGLDRVPNFVIYYTYRKIWSETKWKAFNRIVFFRVFNTMFEQVRTGKQRYYLLNKDSFDMSREGLIEAKHFLKVYNRDEHKGIYGKNRDRSKYGKNNKKKKRGRKPSNFK